ncbi:MAG: hypothetical protein LBL48_03810 [Azoarcus sp.]|jgi:hypothetical protein|nr:hypothetical protein [Azoarcus sp.]
MATEPTSTFPAAIEIFRAGTHTGDDGRAWRFLDDDLRAIATAYDPALSEAPIVVGHPSTDAPAYGWVASVTFSDGRLSIAARDVEPQFAEMVKARRFSKRSAAFYPPEHPSNPAPGQWYLRHVGFLGAQPPAIKGLKEIRFADAAPVVFAEDLPATHSAVRRAAPRTAAPPWGAANEVSVGAIDSHPNMHKEHPMSNETEISLAATEAKFAEADAARQAAQAEVAALKAQIAQFTEARRIERHAAHVSFAEAQIAAGRLLPKDKIEAIAVLDALSEAAPVEFAEGDATKKISLVEFIKNLIAATPPAVQFGEFAPGTAGSRRASEMTDVELDAAARRYAAEKSVSYADALTRVVTVTRGA